MTFTLVGKGQLRNYHYLVVKCIMWHRCLAKRPVAWLMLLRRLLLTMMVKELNYVVW